MTAEEFANGLGMSPKEIAEGKRMGEAVVAHFDQLVAEMRCDTSSLASIWVAEGLNHMRRKIGNQETALWLVEMAMFIAKATDNPTIPTSKRTH